MTKRGGAVKDTGEAPCVLRPVLLIDNDEHDYKHDDIPPPPPRNKKGVSA